MSAGRSRIPSTRTLAVILALVVVATIETWAQSTVAGRDLSGAITSMRSGQIAAEASMRAADKRIKVLKRHSKGAARRLRKTRRRHADAVVRRDAANASARDARGRLAAAQKQLVQQTDALNGLLVELALAPPLAATSTASVTVVGETSSAGAIDGSGGPVRLPHAEAPDTAVERLGSSIAELEEDVGRLRADAHQIERAARKVARKARKAGRMERAARRRVRGIKAGIRSATGQQHASEASLAAYIHGMTRLAHLRAKKKTKGKQAPAFVMPVRARLTQGYSGRHDGLDLAAGQGTPIRAMAPGVVAYVGWNPWDSRPRAFVVVIAHQGGYETKYGHLLPRRGVTLGKLVRRGEVIGYMGNTGHSTGVHLHLEVSRGFHTLNPYSVL